MTAPAATAAAFLARPADATALADAERLAPANPFVTTRFVEAQRALGFDPWVIGVVDHGAPVALTTAFLRQGRLRASCEIYSAPPSDAGSPFWSGLLDFCRARRVTDLSVGSAASPSVSIPALPGEVERWVRTEFVLDLTPDDLMPRLSKSHRERVRKAQRNGVTLQRTTDPAALDAHLGLHNASIQRRLDRGEDAPLQEETRQLRALLESGSGELFQAVRDGTLLSSVLVLRARTGAYSYSSGNSPEGMQCGASHFLTYETALVLKGEGLTAFNRSGARPHETGLADFKARFGATPVPLEAATFDLSTGLRRALVGAVDVARRALARHP